MKKIELLFENADGKEVKYSLDKPVEPVDPAVIKQAMDDIVAENVFYSSGGDLIEPKSARIVENIVEEIEWN